MTIITAKTHEQHQQIQLLLPWYVNESLQPRDRLMVDKHIRHCLLCRRELVSLRQLADAVMQPSELELAAESSFAALAAKLPSRPAMPPAPRSTATKATRQHFGHYLRQPGVRYAMAASLLLALLPLGWHNAPVTTDGSYHTLSAAQPESVPAATALRVVFAKSTAEADISKLLAILHAERMGDVNSMGALTVRLDRPENLEPALALLRSRPDVVLAEPALQP